ncbi:MAG: ABC transporter ATP-binding protein [Planctomycetes bacterium]|nr:ABC transporter ATP-binding protein [Planctomycetota bacterium]
MGTTAVRFDRVSKRFQLGESHDSLRDLLSSGFARLLGKKRPRKPHFWALRGVDFSVQRGEAVGIIGPNGAGKSTVLKLLAGILRPNRGSVRVEGRLAALIEVGAGFHGDLTGRENIFLNGAVLGMRRADIRRKLDDIVEFAGIERFLDTPVKRYSSGMYARLGFSIAAHVDPDILLVDEVLSVGDAVFRLRCIDRMHELVRQGTTLVFVTHNLDQMQAICPRAIVLDRGKTVFAGASRGAISHYMTAMSRAYADRPTDVSAADHDRSSAVELIDVRFVNSSGKRIVWTRSSESMEVEVQFRLRSSIERLVIELNLRATASDNLLSLNSGRSGITFDRKAGEHVVTLRIPRLPVCGGQYFWNVRMWDAATGTSELDTPFRFPLLVDDEGRGTGILCVDHQWEGGDDRTSEPAYASASKRSLEPTVTRVADESLHLL